MAATEEIAWGAFMPVGELRQRLESWELVPDGLLALRLYLERVQAPGGPGTGSPRRGVTPE